MEVLKSALCAGLVPGVMLISFMMAPPSPAMAEDTPTAITLEIITYLDDNLNSMMDGNEPIIPNLESFHVDRARLSSGPYASTTPAFGNDGTLTIHDIPYRGVDVFALPYDLAVEGYEWVTTSYERSDDTTGILYDSAIPSVNSPAPNSTHTILIGLIPTTAPPAHPILAVSSPANVTYGEDIPFTISYTPLMSPLTINMTISNHTHITPTNLTLTHYNTTHIHTVPTHHATTPYNVTLAIQNQTHSTTLVLDGQPVPTDSAFLFVPTDSAFLFVPTIPTSQTNEYAPFGTPTLDNPTKNSGQVGTVTLQGVHTQPPLQPEHLGEFVLWLNLKAAEP